MQKVQTPSNDHMMVSGNFNYDLFPSGQDTVRHLSLVTAQSTILPLAAAVGTSVLAIHSLVNVSFMHACSDKLMYLDKKSAYFPQLFAMAVIQIIHA